MDLPQQADSWAAYRVLHLWDLCRLFLHMLDGGGILQGDLKVVVRVVEPLEGNEGGSQLCPPFTQLKQQVQPDVRPEL